MHLVKIPISVGKQPMKSLLCQTQILGKKKMKKRKKV
jgi:hypothetical protein